jgi:o-succinylbenzoate synthase
MGCDFTFSVYEHQFVQPLQTHYGAWRVRSGIIIQLTTSIEQVSWGEIAPLPWFGSETLEQAIEFCQSLPRHITADTIATIPAHLPACQFGFESAWDALTPDDDFSAQTWDVNTLRYSALLPTGPSALKAWESLWQAGYRTFKWKIGVAPAAEEQALFQLLIQTLPPTTKLRLDANGGLTEDEAKGWLERCDRVTTITIELLEQPLKSNQFQQMCVLSEQYRTPIALDESVATLAQLRACYQQGWRGIFVVKPAIVGSPNQLRQFCRQTPLDLVFSSVFETEIGRQAGLRLAAELATLDRAVGYGVQHWLVESRSA